MKIKDLYRILNKYDLEQEVLLATRSNPSVIDKVIPEIVLKSDNNYYWTTDISEDSKNKINGVFTKVIIINGEVTE